ncbi:streptophobe family protein [Streptomyces sp. CSDS2]|uniref:streptophobe family protein n=1 Tax=Streptomyces sp. CSDS2 TaxID=3055051 RepID=UPI0025AFEC05|nr:streptophobe family protein [Streptomyces sp. CSDS2]MDN3262807.1 streptophobe family protein [Streptomyces sp. CSDS2]
MSAPPSRPSLPVWRHALAGALAAVAALLTMSATAWAALELLGAGAVAPVARLVPVLVSLAVGGGVTLESAAGPAESAEGGLGGLFGGGGGLSLGLAGEVALTPLTLSFLGTAVLATGFFRPLRRRARPTPAMLWARCGGALAITAVALPVCAVLARGTARLPENVKDRIGERAGSGRFGGGAGGGLASGLSSVDFRTDVVTTVFLGCLGVVAVLAVGCLAARRTTLPRPVTLGGPRLKWNAVLSALTGTAAALCCAALAVAVLAAAAALTGRERAAEAAGALLLAGPNLIAALLTTGAGTSWEAGVRRLRPEGGGMAGMLGAGEQDGAADRDRVVDLGHWAGAGVPLWAIGLLLTLLLLLLAGYVAAARTPARTAREDADSLLGRHADTALRMGIAVGAATFVLPYLARGSLRIGVSLMGSEMGGLRAGLDTSPRLSALTAFVAAALAGYGGSRLQSRRARRREHPAGASGTASRRRALTSDPVP